MTDAPKTELAWVIEQGESAVFRPMYLSVSANNSFDWSLNNEKALRFARQGDAALCYAAIRALRPSVFPELVRIAEHGWS